MKEKDMKAVRAFDILKDEEGYKIVNIEYDLESGEATILDVLPVSKGRHMILAAMDSLIGYKIKNLK